MGEQCEQLFGTLGMKKMNPQQSNTPKSECLVSYSKCHFYANMNWWDVAEQPDSMSDLPSEFAQAKALWDKGPEQNMGRILELLHPFVGACFIPSNIEGWEELFVDSSGDGIVEIEPMVVKLVGIDFSSDPFPICKSEAYFDVEVTPAFASTDHDEWQSVNGYFTDGVVFRWDVPRSDETEDLDFTCGDNQGVECYVG